jgi:pyrimidine-nucleoside phosphorylase
VKSVVELIAKKRDGGEHTPDEVKRLIRAFCDGDLADYQLSAWLMAVFFRGMTPPETVALTEAMLHSGDVVDLSDVPGKKVDKHSTGGVGDKVSICLAPLVAACGVRVPMVSGRGLGHTGGTLDKLEAIPGFSVTLDEARFRDLVRDVGTAMIGQTARIAPADKRIYALRDVTATVESIPLIVASILSKKLAEGIDGLVLDVKVGRGAFMKTREAARELARALVRVGTDAGKRVSALLTRMDEPLGLAIGNANETHEALLVLGGGGPPDLVDCTMALGEEMLLLGEVAETREEARAKLDHARPRPPPGRARGRDGANGRGAGRRPTRGAGPRAPGRGRGRGRRAGRACRVRRQHRRAGARARGRRDGGGAHARRPSGGSWRRDPPRGEDRRRGRRG